MYVYRKIIGFSYKKNHVCGHLFQSFKGHTYFILTTQQQASFLECDPRVVKCINTFSKAAVIWCSAFKLQDNQSSMLDQYIFIQTERIDTQNCLKKEK